MGYHGKKDVKKRIIGGSMLLCAGFLLFFISRISQPFSVWYSVHIYPLLVESIGRAAGVFPFSVSEVLLYLLLLWLILTGAAWINRAVRRKGGLASPGGSSDTARGNGKGAGSMLSSLFLIAAVLFFLYEANCGVNYHRESFSESSGIQVREYLVEDLREVCLWLTREVNTASGTVARDEKGIMTVSPDADEKAVEAMQRLGNEYEELDGYYPKPKGLLVPQILAVQNLSGIYSPFTVEANYNSGMTDYNIPFTMCHELSHLRSFMQEQEANFIAFLACRISEEEEFRYSGNLMGWIYCMNVLRRTDYEAWEEVRGLLSPEVEKDLQENHDYWSRYDGAIAEVSNQVNDTYLKANGQAEGVKSYNRMVDLIVEYYDTSAKLLQRRR